MQPTTRCRSRHARSCTSDSRTGWKSRLASDGTEYEEILGHHLAEAHRYRSELALADDAGADLRPRAWRSYLGHGRVRAADRGDFHGARPLLERAVELVGDDPRRPDFLERLGEVLDAQAEPRLARERLEEAIRGFQAQNDPVSPTARAEVGLLAVRSSLESLEMEDVVTRERGAGRRCSTRRATSAAGQGRRSWWGSHLFFLGRITEAERRLDRVVGPRADRSRRSVASWRTG